MNKENKSDNLIVEIGKTLLAFKNKIPSPENIHDTAVKIVQQVRDPHFWDAKEDGFDYHVEQDALSRKVRAFLDADGTDRDRVLRNQYLRFHLHLIDRTGIADMVWEWEFDVMNRAFSERARQHFFDIVSADYEYTFSVGSSAAEAQEAYHAEALVRLDKLNDMVTAMRDIGLRVDPQADKVFGLEVWKKME